MSAKLSMPEFNFLSEKSKKEPNIIELLSEIYSLQNQSLPEGEAPLATLEYLQNSRNIKIPFTSARNRHIEYLIEHLTHNYPEMFKPIVTFSFIDDEKTKKLEVQETVEYTVMLAPDQFETLRKIREKRSIDNFLSFISKYRLINLSKIIKKAKHKNELTQILKLELGKSFFTYKNYNLDKNKIEYAEDYCFHAKNYEKVKSSLNFKRLNEIISMYEELVLRRLKKYGIISPDTSDYRDKKLDYLLHILLDELQTALTDQEVIEIKNFQSLRNCLLKVDTILDPILILGSDIVKLVRENSILQKSEIFYAIPELTDELFAKWMNPETLMAQRIIAHQNDDQLFLIDGMRFFATISEMAERMLYHPEKLNILAPTERAELEQRFELYVKAAESLLQNEAVAQKTLNAAEGTLESLHKIIDDYKGKQVQQIAKKELKKIKISKQKTSLIRKIINFFKTLFAKEKVIQKESHTQHVPTKPISQETQKLYDKIAEREDPIIPLSDYIVLSESNSAEIDKTIQELRENNLKIVVPIYNAREVLYPKRSKKILLPDVEYLLISPEVCQSPEEIRAFTDSLSGYKIKDDVLSIKAILAIEKYLLTLYRQKRALLFKKEL